MTHLQLLMMSDFSGLYTEPDAVADHAHRGWLHARHPEDHDAPRARALSRRGRAEGGAGLGPAHPGHHPRHGQVQRRVRGAGQTPGVHHLRQPSPPPLLSRSRPLQGNVKQQIIKINLSRIHQISRKCPSCSILTISCRSWSRCTQHCSRLLLSLEKSLISRRCPSCWWIIMHN